MRAGVNLSVAPRAGAWIETNNPLINALLSWSLPARERGLKQVVLVLLLPPLVAPRAGAWIETITTLWPSMVTLVAPRAGAWIETFKYAGLM